MDKDQLQEIIKEQNPSKLDRLTEEISETNELLKSTNDPKKIILRGLLYGLSTVVGATILVSIIYSFVRDIPFVGDTVNGILNSREK